MSRHTLRVESKRSSVALLWSLLCVLLVTRECYAKHNTTTRIEAKSESASESEPGTAKALASTAQRGDFAVHHFVNRNNITILHEVSAERERDERPLTLNTHEILPLKPLKKKPYLPLEKVLPSIEYTKPHSHALKEYELHPVTFDFNLSDLEDLEHEVIKKGELSSEEQHVLSNGDASEFSYRSTNPDDNDTVDVDISELVEGASTEAAPVASTSTATTTTTTTTTETTTTATVATTTTAMEAATTTTTTPSTHILKILRNSNKASTKKGRELLKQSDEDLQLKTLGSTINSISRYLVSNGSSNPNASMAESLYGSANYFQIVTNLYDHFYWQISEIRTSVRTGCGLEMQAYLTALHSSYEWAQKGE